MHLHKQNQYIYKFNILNRSLNSLILFVKTIYHYNCYNIILNRETIKIQIIKITYKIHKLYKTN